MPRFIDTHTGQFHWVEDPSTVIYAILSHTWRPRSEGGEQSYTEIQKLWNDTRKDRTPGDELGGEDSSTTLQPDVLYSAPLDPPSEPIPTSHSILSHSHISEKIKGICKVARENGYRLIWIDSCCIDKSSSAELAEAINSMFQLYKLADVCYVYLADVPGCPSDPQGAVLADIDFRRSRWHKRGWTLQELLAPKNVVFLTAQWGLLGTKTGLAATLERITGVDFGILIGKTTLDSVSVARRMSWASARETTRVEDEAYCLLGIFGVHLSPIYGEGHNAFLRLQEEIIKTIPDQSIFAWGEPCRLYSLETLSLDQSIAPRSETPSGLLAHSPRSFQSSRDVISLYPEEFWSRLSCGLSSTPSSNLSLAAPPLHCVFTPQGVRVQLLCVELPDEETHQLTLSCRSSNLAPSASCFLHGTEGTSDYLALLQCEDGHGSILALVLTPPVAATGGHRGLNVANSLSFEYPYRPSCRLVLLCQRAINDIQTCLRSEEVTILRCSPLGPELCDNTSLNIRVSLWRAGVRLDHAEFSVSEEAIIPYPPLAKFYLAPWCAERLRVLGFSISPLNVEYTQSGQQIVLSTSLTSTFVQSSALEGQGRDGQIIHITLTLTYIDRATRKYEWRNRPDTMVCFSVVHSYVDARGVLSKAPRDNVGIRIGEIHTLPEAKTTERRALSETEFVLLMPGAVSDAGTPVELCDKRFLRLALECPPDAIRKSTRDLNNIAYLLLSVELSDSFTHFLHMPVVWDTPRPEATICPQVQAQDATPDLAQLPPRSWFDSAKRFLMVSIPAFFEYFDF
ncbi:hypothetical protein VTO73DRAFT_3382 [Trametes versicolor]